MTTRKSLYQERKDRVLGIVVNEYIQTVTPVSSGYIAKSYIRDLSPATIRNILAELEQEGLLTHPHTSAGRMPTEEGYRYYVDNLMNEIQLLEGEKTRIKTEYEQEKINLETLMEKTSEVISDLTHYTSIISVDGLDGKIFCKGTSYVVSYPETQDIEKIRDVLYTLEEKERILHIINRDLREKIKIYIGHEIALREMEFCSLAVSSYELHDGNSGRIAVLGPTRMDYQRVVSALDYVTSVLNKIL